MVHSHDRGDQGFERALRQSLAAPAALPSGDCVDAETLAAWSDGSLAPMQASSVELHLSTCPSCQAFVAAFVRTTPAQPVTVPLWRRWQLQWLVPLATATAALIVYLAIPGRTPAQLAPEGVSRSSVQLNSSSSPSVSAEARAELPRPGAPAALPTPPHDVPRGTAPLPSQVAAADALAKVQLKREKEKEGRVSAVADARTSPNSDLLAAEAAARARAALEERKVADAAAAAPAAARPAVPTPSATTAEARPAAPSPSAPTGVPVAETPAPPPAATPGRRAQVAGLAQARAFKVSTTDVTSPTLATRWRIAIGGPVDYFGTSAPSGRPTDIPAAAVILAGSAPQDDVCWMVGRGGAVYVTTDGTHFTRVAFPDVVDLVAVRATDAKTAMVIAATGRTYRTTDAGKTWQSQ